MRGHTSSTIIILLLFCLKANTQDSLRCLPDKGIRIATISAKIEQNLPNNNTEESYRETIHFNTEGQPILIKKIRKEVEHSREYESGKLKYIITSRKELPSFYAAGQLDSQTADVVKDTAIITSHHTDGRPKIMQASDSTSLIFAYKGCQEELQTLLAVNGDTIHQYQISYENGVIATTSWTPFMPTQSTISTRYYGYKFNQDGYWIERKYKRREGVILERRELTYY